jgi:hypothetical protein
MALESKLRRSTKMKRSTFAIAPELPCGRRGRYAVARLIAKGGDAKLTELLPALIPRYRPLPPHDR